MWVAGELGCSSFLLTVFSGHRFLEKTGHDSNLFIYFVILFLLLDHCRGEKVITGQCVAAGEGYG